MAHRATRYGCARRMTRLTKLMKRDIETFVGKRPTIQKAIQAHRDMMILKGRLKVA